jgi:hypothetical protein
MNMKLKELKSGDQFLYPPQCKTAYVKLPAKIYSPAGYEWTAKRCSDGMNVYIGLDSMVYSLTLPIQAQNR